MTETTETLHFLDYWRVVSSRKEIVIATALLVVLIGVLITLNLPKVYSSSTVIQVREDAPDLDVTSSSRSRFDPLFLRTQFEIIQSEPVVEEVVRNLRLDEKFGKAMGYLDVMGDKAFRQTVRIVSQSMRVQQFRDTNLIEIQMYLSEPKDTVWDEVATIANEVAHVFREQTVGRRRSIKAKALEALKQSVDELQKKVLTAENELEAVRQKYQIDVVSSVSGTDSSLGKLNMRETEQSMIQLRLDLEGKKAKLDKVVSLSGEELLAAAPYIANDPGLNELVATRRRFDVELSRLVEAQFGPKHPEVARAEAAVREVNLKIAEALTGLKIGVQADFEAAQARYDVMEKMLEAIKDTERQAAGTGYREFERVKQDVEHARRMRDELEIRYNEEIVEQKIPRTTVDIIKPAQPADRESPVSPDYALNIILSILLGLGAGVALAYFIEYLDTSVKTIEEIERSMGVSALGVIPQKVKPFTDPSADMAHEEAYRVLRTNLRFARRFQDGKKVLCVTSGSVGEGKSLTLFNLAYVCATLGDRVILIDADLHRPRQHRMLNVSNAVGLANVLVGDKALSDVILNTSVQNLDFIPSGKLQGSVHGLLDAERVRQVATALKGAYDLVLFDAPPIIGVSDASMLAREMDGVLLVIQHRKYPKSVSNRARSMIENLGGNLVGVVLNNINVSRDHSYYYYHQHYNTYPDKKRGKANPA